MKHIFQIIFCLVIAVILNGCLGSGGGGNKGSSSPPVTGSPSPSPSPTPSPLHVTSPDPAGATQIEVDDVIKITFDKPIQMPSDIGTLTNDDDVRMVGANHHPIKVAISGNVMTIEPVINFDPDTEYKLTITTDLEATDGGVLPQAYIKTFRTLPAKQTDTVFRLKWCYEVTTEPRMFFAQWGEKKGVRPNEQKMSHQLIGSSAADRDWCGMDDFNVYTAVVDYQVETGKTYYVTATACYKHFTFLYCSANSNEISLAF